MKIIDFHTHYFPDDLATRAISQIRDHVPFMTNYTDGTLSGLIKSMKESGIEKSVTLPVATKPTQVKIINNAVFKLKDTNIIPFAAIHPDFKNFESEIIRIKDAEVKGVKLHPEYQEFMADDKVVYPIYEELSSRGLIALFHAGKDPWPVRNKGAYPKRLKNIVRDFPKLKIVAAHLGGWDMWDEVYDVLASENIFFDTSAIIKRVSEKLFMKIIKKHGTEKILFGTDSPWLSQKESIKYIQKMPLTESEKEMILHGNATNLLSTP